MSNKRIKLSNFMDQLADKIEAEERNKARKTAKTTQSPKKGMPNTSMRKAQISAANKLMLVANELLASCGMNSSKSKKKSKKNKKRNRK
jgi:hypothetical protein